MPEFVRNITLEQVFEKVKDLKKTYFWITQGNLTEWKELPKYMEGMTIISTAVGVRAPDWSKIYVLVTATSDPDLREKNIIFPIGEYSNPEEIRKKFPKLFEVNGNLDILF